MQKLFKSSFLLSGTEIGLIIINIFRTKYLALNVGPEGLGIYSILNSFFLIASAFCGGWFSVSYIKYVSEYTKKGASSSVSKIHNLSLSITFLSVGILLILFLTFRPFVKRHFLSTDIIDFHYYIFISIFILNSLKFIYTYYLNATILLKETIKARIINSIAELIAVIVLVYYFQIVGFFISLLISAAFGLYIFRFFTRKHIKEKLGSLSLNIPEKKMFFHTGLKNIPLLFINNFSQYFFRLTILSNLNLASVGIFHALNNLTSYVGIFNRGTNYSYVPQMGQHLETKNKNLALNNYLKLNISVGIIITTVAIFSIDFMMKLFFSKDFAQTVAYSHLFLIAQFTTIFVSAFQAITVGMNNYKTHFLVVIISNIIWIVIPMLFINKLGIKSIAYSFLLANFWSITCNYIILYKNHEIKVSIRILLISLLSLVLLIVASYLKNKNVNYQILIIILEIFLISFLFNKEERLSLVNKIKLTFKNG